MKTLMEYWNLTLSGFTHWMSVYKYLPLIIGILIYGYIFRERYKSRMQREFWLYGLISMTLFIIPVTGLFFLIYQTRFYDYGWGWSMVPLTAILAVGVVEIVFEQLTPGMEIAGQELKEKMVIPARVCALLAAAAVLFMLGNQGRLQRVSEEGLQVRQESEEILQYMEEQRLLQDTVLWGPKDVLQYLRSHNGEVTLFYGRDMWDAKAGAYDYDIYDEVEIGCYNWIETVSDELNLYLLEVQQAPKEVHEALATEEFLQEAVKRGADLIILPTEVTPWVERKIQFIAEECEIKISTALVGKYTLWCLE